jgi:hypothetical protein
MSVRGSLVPLLVLVLSVVVTASGFADPLAVLACGDFIWSPCEHCGKDAYSATGHTEMTHDCALDVVDFALFAQDFGLVQSDLSGDFNRDGRVDLLDFQMFYNCYYSHPQVTPCAPCALPDSCAGTIRINFSHLVQEDVDRIDLEPYEVGTLRVVVEGCSGMAAVQIGLEGTANVVFGSIQGTGLNIPGPDGASIGVGYMSPLGSGPVHVAGIEFYVTDSEPAAIRLVDRPAHDLAWALLDPLNRMEFRVIAHGGVNGDPPPDESGCPVTAIAAAPPSNAASWLVCWPIPASGAVHITTTLDSPLDANVDVVDGQGRIVRRLLDGVVAPGAAFTWDGRTENGQPAAPGVYWIRASSPGRTISKKVVLLRP